ncbi:MAG: hypothetical protein AB1714_15250 [Acidobacteriota bacterium]
MDEMTVLTDHQKLAICAAYFAAGHPDGDFDSLVGWARSAHLVAELRHLLASLDALPLIRRMNRAAPTDTASQTVTVRDDRISLGGQEIGNLVRWYRSVLPQEMQTRIAYDTLIHRFLGYLATTRKIVALSQHDAAILAFVPRAADSSLDTAWPDFVSRAFSRQELLKTFVLLLNSVKLTDRGFGAARFPAVTRDTAEVQAALYLATLEDRILYGSNNHRAARKRYLALSAQRHKAEQKGDSRRLSELDKELGDVTKERTSALKNNRRDYEKAVRDLGKEIPADALRRLRLLASRFNSLARTQFSYGTVGTDKLAKMIPDLLEAPAGYRPICPIRINTAEVTPCRPGDAQSDVCYACGNPLPGKDFVKANRIIFGASSQRLQSGKSQDEPRVCCTCASVAMICPVKFRQGSVVVRLALHASADEQESSRYLRMMTLGELNLAAGPYLLMKCTEAVQIQKAGRSRWVPVADPMGLLQYALFKVGTTLPRDVLGNCCASLIGGDEQQMPVRWMVWLSYLQEIFDLRLTQYDAKSGRQRPNHAAFEAVRLVQKEQVIKATYALLIADESEPRRLTMRSRAELRLLEELRQSHCDLLKEVNMAERATLFRHVAGLTGLLDAFCRQVQNEAEKAGKNTKREVTKLIEEVTDPYQFIYRATHNLSGEMATIYRNPDNYFCFDEAQKLLAGLEGVNITERQGMTEQGTPFLRAYFDDLRNVYASLFGSVYKSDKEQKDVATEIRLSLAAKYPEYYVKEKGE